MDTLTITNNNKLIAEFDGLKKDSYGRFFKEYKFMAYNESEFKYHTDWNWLMPVIKKCYLIEAPTKNGWSKADRIQTVIDTISFFQNDIVDVWLSVIEFINWYNKEINER